MAIICNRERTRPSSIFLRRWLPTELHFSSPFVSTCPANGDEEGLIIWHDITATNGVTVTAFSLVIFNFGLRNSICSVPSSLRSSICPEHHRRNIALSTTRFVFPYMPLEILACISLATKPSLLLDPCPTDCSGCTISVPI